MSSSHLILIDLSCSDCLTERPCARSGVCEDSVCVPHSSTLRIKSFDSLNTQSRSSKLLQPQYRSLVSYHDDSNDGRHNTKLILEYIPRSLSGFAHTLPVFPSGHVGGQRVWPPAGQGALRLPADQRGRALLLQGRHHQREPAGGRGLVGRLVQRQVWVVPQQLRAGAERKRWVERLFASFFTTARTKSTSVYSRACNTD